MSGNGLPGGRSGGTGAQPGESGGSGLGRDETRCPNCTAVVKTNAELCPSCGLHLGGGTGTGGGTVGGSTAVKDPMGRYPAALVGAMVTLVVGFVLPVIGNIAGGALAGYLRGSGNRESTITGALSGVFSAIPGVLIILLIGGIFGITGLASGEALFGVGSLLFVAAIIVAVLLFAGGMNAIGGYIGAEVSDRRAP